MKTPAYTPGPWNLTKDFASVGPDKLAIYADNCGTCVARLDHWRTADAAAEMEANGRLLAASPDLLAALRYALAILDQPVAKRLAAENPILAGDLASLRNNAQAAIAQATGSRSWPTEAQLAKEAADLEAAR